MSTSKRLTHGEKLGLSVGVIGLILAAAGVAVGLYVPEVRCYLGIDQCQSASSPAGRGDPTEIPAAPGDASMPFVIESPTPHQVKGQAPSVELAFNSIVNRGVPVVVPIFGSGFTTSTCAKFEWYQPDGSTYESTCLQVDDRGLFDTKLLWLPMQWRGVAGNDGAWKMRITDDSGKQVVAQMQVTSDADTPPPDQWAARDPLDLPAKGMPSLQAGSSGSLCGSNGLMVEVRGEGFTPESTAELYYLRPDGMSVMSQGVSINAAGQLDRAQSFWSVDGCDTNREWEYTILLRDHSGRSGQTRVGMPTSD